MFMLDSSETNLSSRNKLQIEYHNENNEIKQNNKRLLNLRSKFHISLKSNRYIYIYKENNFLRQIQFF